MVGIHATGSLTADVDDLNIREAVGVQVGAEVVANCLRVLVRNKAALRQALTNLAAIPDLRLVTVAHGHAVREACGEALREAAASL